MLTRLVRVVRTDVLDAITALKTREYKCALPACIYGRIYK